MISPAPPRLVAVRYPWRMSRRFVLLALALVAAAIAMRYTRNRADESDTGATTQPAPLATRAAPASVQEPQSSTGSSGSTDLLAALVAPSPPSPPPPPPPMLPEPLPPWDAKLADVLPALKARADAGDHAAACHIGLALSACALWLDSQPSAAALRQMRLNDEGTIERMARLAADTYRPGRENTCKGLPAQALEQRFAYLQQAADAGNDAAMLAFAEGVPLLGIETTVSHPEWVEAHRRLAPSYLIELIRRGDRYAAFLVFMASDGMQVSFLGQALQMDEMTAATFWYLGREVLGQPGDPWHGPSPSIAHTAQERARVVHRRFFEQRPFQSGEFQDRHDLMHVERCGAKP